MKFTSGIILVTVALTVMATVVGQGTRCATLGGLIDNTQWQHCAIVRQNLVQIYYDLSDTDIKACVEGKTDGWVGLGFGGNGSDYVIGWNPGGAGVTVGDYAGHTATTKDGTQNHTVYTKAGKTKDGEQNGVTHFCFERLLDTGDAADDTILKVDQFMNFPWAIKGGDPGNANNLDAVQHGSDGTASWKLSDPTEERPPPDNVNGGEGGGEGPPEGVLIAVGAVAGVLVLVGVGYMVKQNNAQVAAYGGGMDGGWGHGGYGSSTSQGSHRSRSKGHRSHRSRSRSRGSHSSKRSRGSSKHSQTSHRSRSKGHRHH